MGGKQGEAVGQGKAWGGTTESLGALLCRGSAGVRSCCAVQQLQTTCKQLVATQSSILADASDANSQPRRQGGIDAEKSDSLPTPYIVSPSCAWYRGTSHRPCRQADGMGGVRNVSQPCY